MVKKKGRKNMMQNAINLTNNIHEMTFKTNVITNRS